MASNRLIRVNELLKREVASALLRLLPGDSINLSTVTVTDAEISPNLRNAKIFVSVMGTEEDKRRMLAAVWHCREELQEEIRKSVVLKYVPRLTFQLDRSIEKGDHVLDVLHQLELENPKLFDSQREPPA